MMRSAEFSTASLLFMLCVEVPAPPQTHHHLVLGYLGYFVRICDSRFSSTVTEKGYVSESYSESEDDFKATKQAAGGPVKAKPSSSNKEDEKKSQKKASGNANKGTKQASIMGFFQKKWQSDTFIGTEDKQAAAAESSAQCTSHGRSEWHFIFCFFCSYMLWIYVQLNKHLKTEMCLSSQEN